MDITLIKNNDQLFELVRNLCEKYNDEKDEDKYRKECIELVFNNFNFTIEESGTIFDLAMCNNWIYLTDTDCEFEFNIEYDWESFKCFETWNYGKDYYITYTFKWWIPIKQMFYDLDMIWKAMDDLNNKELVKTYLI